MRRRKETFEMSFSQSESILLRAGSRFPFRKHSSISTHQFLVRPSWWQFAPLSYCFGKPYLWFSDGLVGEVTTSGETLGASLTPRPCRSLNSDA